jgi:hypothetical protein
VIRSLDQPRGGGGPCGSGLSRKSAASSRTMAREAPDLVGRLPDRPAGNSGHPLNLEPPVYDPYGLDSRCRPRIGRRRHDPPLARPNSCSPRSRPYPTARADPPEAAVVRARTPPLLRLALLPAARVAPPPGLRD